MRRVFLFGKCGTLLLLASPEDFAVLSLLVRETVDSARTACERTHLVRARSLALREELRLEREARATLLICASIR